MKLLAALSGGVDSAVAAALAVDAGHEVTAVHLALSLAPAALRTGSRGCCSREDARDAARVADVLGIPFYVWDLAAQFRDDVIEEFVAEYAAGRTPNPCVTCNEKIKFAAVLDRALSLGFDAVVTGHHARLVDGVLSRSADPAKDQSYVLAVLTPAQLASTVLPLGALTKDQVRDIARAKGLGVADKAESHDICFIPDGDTAGFLRKHLGPQPGPVVDSVTGQVLAEHEGAYAFTIGQRRGLGVTVPAPDGRPRYVLSIEPVSRTVTVGPAAARDVSHVAVSSPRWHREVDLPARFLVQWQAHGTARPCTVTASFSGLELALESPTARPAPGQAVVLYDGATVIGSAVAA